MVVTVLAPGRRACRLVRLNGLSGTVAELPVEGKFTLASTEWRAQEDRLPASPFPDGWYFVASRDVLRKQTLIERTWLGQEIVAWCDDKGSVCVADAHCPHLGSHLGPQTGGKVRNGCLVCPFHGFEYDVTGQCVATPNAPAPKNARLQRFETQTINGLVFAWWSSVGEPPYFRLPLDRRDENGWTAVGLRTFRLTCHPEHTAENAVDLAHFSHIHGYADVQQVGSVTVDGTHLMSAFNFKRERSVLGSRLLFDVSVVTNVYGMGYSAVDIVEHTIPFKSRFWVLATPLDGTHMDLVLANQTQETDRVRRVIVGLGFLPKRTRAKLMNYMLMEGQVKDVEQDVPIWNRKIFRPRPVLSSEDGKIMLYRRYCSQFYPENVSAAGQTRRKLVSL